MNNLINAKERLPDNTEEVLAKTEAGFVVAWYRKADKTWHIDLDSCWVMGDCWISIDEDITHWQELPKD